MPDTPWWRDAVVYQIYPRSFADSNGDGVGDLAGITSKLDYLADLGVDALWLSPIFTSPMRDFGYDVADYCGIDPVFGTDADFDDLITGLHDRGMRLLLDWVPNHTSSDHPWFVESRSSRDNPRRDWYVWRDPKPDGSPPTNWVSQFKGVPAWTFDEATAQSYLHVFLSEQPDLNWANPDVEAAMLDTLRYWLDRGVDGFRSDVVNLIGKGTEVDDLPEHLVTMPLLATDRPFGHELLRRIRSLLDSYDHDPMMVGEVYLLRDGESASYVGTPAAPELHLSFDFRPLHTPWDAARMRRALEKMEADFDEPCWPTFVLSNHDQPRHRTRLRLRGEGSGCGGHGAHRARHAVPLRGRGAGTGGRRGAARTGRRPRRARRVPRSDPVDRRRRRRGRPRLAGQAVVAVPGECIDPLGVGAGRRTPTRCTRCTASCWRCAATARCCGVARSSSRRPTARSSGSTACSTTPD